MPTMKKTLCKTHRICNSASTSNKRTISSNSAKKSSEPKSSQEGWRGAANDNSAGDHQLPRAGMPSTICVYTVTDLKEPGRVSALLKDKLGNTDTDNRLILAIPLFHRANYPMPSTKAGDAAGVEQIDQDGDNANFT
jgi:hypothetical protein